MFKILNQPYPLEISFQKNLRISLATGIFITAFLYVFQPVNVLFGIELLAFWVTLVYGLISSIVMFTSFYISPKYLPEFFKEETWLVKNELIHFFFTVVVIAFFNFIFAAFITGAIINVFISVIGSTFLLAFFPLSFIVFYKQNLFLKKYLVETDLINSALQNTIHDENLIIEGDGKNESISFQLENLDFVKSQGNYCEFYFENSKQKEVLRISLVNVQKQISSTIIYKCHRSYLVHLNNIVKVSGNAQGLRLHFKNQEESIPVSRSLSNELRSLLLKN